MNPESKEHYSVWICIMMTYRYINPSRNFKVIRVSNITGFYLERTAFSGQVMLLQVPLGAELEVYAAPVTMLREDTIRCSEAAAVS